MTAVGIVRHPAGREALRVLLSAAESADSLGVVELELEPGGSGPPLHVHPTHDEGFYVLAGELTVRVGDDVVAGGPGTWAFAPRDVPHTLGNLGSATVRLLATFSPGGFERRFERILAELSGAPLPEMSPAQLATQRVGPPLAPGGAS